MDRRESETSLHSHKSGGGSSGVASESRDSKDSADSNVETGGRFLWKNQWQHILFFLSYTFSWETFASYLHGTIEDIDYQPTVIHFLICCAIFMGPTIFIETFIGQYTQKGCTVIGAMLPVAYGLAFCFLLTTLIDVIVNSYYNTVIFYYVLLSIVNWPIPSWMFCHPEFLEKHPKCFSIDLIDKCAGCFSSNGSKCFEKKENQFSSKIFKDDIILGADFEAEDDGNISDLNWKQFGHLVVCFIIIGLLATRELRDLDGAVRICNVFALISIILIVFVIFLHSKSLKGLYAMFEEIIDNSNSLVTWETWLLTFMRLARITKVACGGYILFGTFLTPTTNTKRRAFSMSVAMISVFIIVGTFTFTMKDFLLCKLSVPMSDFKHVSNHDLTFVLHPTALGILPAAPLWSSVFFIVLYTMTLLPVALQVIIIEETLSDEIQSESYYIYIRIAIIIVAFIAAATLTIMKKGSYLAEKIMMYRSYIILINLFLFYLVIFIYGVQRISDDIHFLLRRPTSFFFRAFTILTPILCLVAFINFYSLIQMQVLKEILIILICLYFAPLAVGLIFKIVKAVKAKNLTGLLMPAEEWGPSDVETRTMRRLYTPRFEVRYRRRFDRCRHRCLLNSPVLLKTLEKELAQLSNVLLEIEDNEEEKETKRDVIIALRRHRDIMANFIAETSLHKNYHD